MPKPTKTASVSLDMDNCWAYLRTHGDESWSSFPSFLHIAVPRIAEFFSTYNVRPTVFVVGKDLDLDDGKKALDTFSALDFEIGNHSETHRVDFHNLSEEGIEEEISVCGDKILSLTGYRPLGFRGPSFQLSEEIANKLVELNYRYDASSYPTSIGPLARAYHLFHAKLSREEKRKQRHLFGGFRSAFAPLERYDWQLDSGALIEVPVTTMPILRLPIHFTYLNYLADFSQTLASVYFKSALSLLHSFNVKPCLLFHATDFLGKSDPLVPAFLPGMKSDADRKIAFLHKLFHSFEKDYSGRGIMESLGLDPIPSGQ